MVAKEINRAEKKLRLGHFCNGGQHTLKIDFLKTYKMSEVWYDVDSGKGYSYGSKTKVLKVIWLFKVVLGKKA